MPFTISIKRKAWKRQGELCAHCGKRLVSANQNRGKVGAWHAHHRKPERYHGSNTLHNCAILCINPPENCHFNVGHGGKGYDHYHPLSATEIPYLYAGIKKKKAKKRKKHFK